MAGLALRAAVATTARLTQSRYTYLMSTGIINLTAEFLTGNQWCDDTRCGRGESMSDPSRTTYLVSCVSKKSPMPAQAKDLYKSGWFLKARDYVESTRSPWFILSAKYGLVPPDRILAPYEQTLNTMRKSDRQKWATICCVVT
jgi:hypothetical protein